MTTKTYNIEEMQGNHLTRASNKINKKLNKI